MAKELASDKQLIEDPSLSINTYNYSAIRDRLIKREITVSLSTIINRAKDLDCYQSRPRKMAHDREVVTTAIGTLINTMPPAIAGRLTPKKSGFLSLPWMISAGNSSMPISLNRKQPGLTSKRLRL